MMGGEKAFKNNINFIEDKEAEGHRCLILCIGPKYSDLCRNDEKNVPTASLAVPAVSNSCDAPVTMPMLFSASPARTVGIYFENLSPCFFP
jgi:hypothetical protein